MNPTRTAIPLPQRGRQPVPYRTHAPGVIVIRVRREFLIRKEHEGRWLMKAKPITACRQVATTLAARGFSDDVGYSVLPAAPQSMRLLWRAVREYKEGRYFRASHLAERALSAACLEVEHGCWHSLRIVDIIRGFSFDITFKDDTSPVGDLWRQQADWWAGGQWPGGGKLGTMCNRIHKAVVRIAKEEEEAAGRRLAEAS